MNRFINSKIFLLLFYSILFALLLGEIGVRAYFYLDGHNYFYKKPISTLNDAYDDFKYCGIGCYDNKKLDRFPLMRFSSFIEYFPLSNFEGNGYSTNQWGFRDKDNLDEKKISGEIRMFVVGGSTAWGAGVIQEHLYMEMLDKELNQAFDNNIKVINAGVGAYLNTHERILVLNVIQRFDPDILLIFSGWNDTYAEYTGKRVIDDTWDYLKISPLLAVYHDRFRLNIFPEALMYRPPKYGEYLVKMRYLVDKITFKAAAVKVKTELKKRAIEPSVLYGDLIYNLNAIVHALKNKGTKVIYNLQPSLYNTKKKLSAYERNLVDMGNKNYTLFPEYNSKLYNIYRADLVEYCRINDVYFFDGDLAIEDESLTVFEDHVHFSDRGNKLLAKDMLPKLKDIISDI